MEEEGEYLKKKFLMNIVIFFYKLTIKYPAQDKDSHDTVKPD